MWKELVLCILDLPILFVCVGWHMLVWTFFWVIPTPKKCVRDKVVLVTDGGRGLGRALAVRFAQEGARIALVDRQESVLQTAQELNSLCAKVQAYQCDVTKRNLVSQLASEVRRDFGDIDILVNNAGIFNAKEFANLTEGEIRRTIDVNLFSVFWMLQEFLPAMKKHNSGHIVNMASIAGKLGIAVETDYCASKHAVVGLTAALREELRTNGFHGVKTSVVCPIFVKTDLLKNVQVKPDPFCRFEPAMETDYVADRIVNAVLRDEYLIYLPRRVWLFDLLDSICPVKVMDAIRDYCSVGFFPAKKAV